jgi:hypothetical protein
LRRIGTAVPSAGADLGYRGDHVAADPDRLPCFGAALAGYVEATIDDDDAKNRLCPPSPYSNTPADWARMQVLGNRASMSFAAHPGIKAWADRVSLNPARIPPDNADSIELTAAVERFREHVGAAMARMTELADMS